MRDRRQLTRRRPRAALLWALGLFLAGQLGLAGTMALWRPELRDPEYVCRRNRLRQQLRTRPPGQPLVVALGSSRVAQGLRPEAVVHRPGAPLLFNFGMVGGGPVMELIYLRRLLADGIRPDLVLVEVWPPFWVDQGPLREIDRIALDRLTVADLALVSAYRMEGWSVFRLWAQDQLLPWFSHRFKLMSMLAPNWLPYHLRKDYTFKPLDAWGWLPGQAIGLSRELYQRRFQDVRAYFGPILQNYAIDNACRRATRDLLQLCQDQGIGVALLYLPEGKDFQELYTPEARRRSEKFLRKMLADYSVPLIDARDWVAATNFQDGFHLLADGARRFTERLERDGIRPLLEGDAVP